MNSPYYIERAADTTFAQSIAHQDSLVLVKGPRQTGKTSLLARGLHYAREIGCAVALTDMQKLGSEQWTSADAFYLALAQSLADQLELDVLPAPVEPGAQRQRQLRALPAPRRAARAGAAARVGTG